MIWIIGLFVVVMLAYFFIACSSAIWQYSSNNYQVVIYNLILLFLALISWRFAFPGIFSLVIYQGLIVHIGFIPPILIGIAGLLYAFSLFEDKNKHGLGIACGVVTILIASTGIIYVITGNKWKTAEEYPFTKREGPIAVDSDAIRFTPYRVAAKLMQDKYSSSKFTVERDRTDWIDLSGNSAFRIPTTPSGALQPFLAKNEGFVTWNDSFEISENRRFIRTAQEYQVGEGMYWLDNIERKLYARDPWCKYSDIFYLNLGKKGSEGGETEIVAVAPQIKFSYRFPFFFVKKWSGVTLVFQDGKIEHLSVEDVQQDPRFKGKFAFPVSLSAEIVKAQKYDKGYLSGWYRREDKPQVPELPGEIQWPFRFKASNGRYYDVTATEPDGENRALFRFYYVDCLSGECNYFEMDVNRGFTGPVTAMEYVKQLQGYVFYEGSDESESGTHRIVEPRYIVHDRGIYWHFSITTKEFSQVVSTVLVDAESNEVIEFKQRKKFKRWLNGNTIKDESSASNVSHKLGEEEMREIEESIKIIEAELKKLRTHIELHRAP